MQRTYYKITYIKHDVPNMMHDVPNFMLFDGAHQCKYYSPGCYLLCVSKERGIGKHDKGSYYTIECNWN